MDTFPEEVRIERWFDEHAFALLYTGHGGSGLSLTLDDVEDMAVTDIKWWVERLGEQRKADAEALKPPSK